MNFFLDYYTNRTKEKKRKRGRESEKKTNKRTQLTMSYFERWKKKDWNAYKFLFSNENDFSIEKRNNESGLFFTRHFNCSSVHLWWVIIINCQATWKPCSRTTINRLQRMFNVKNDSEIFKLRIGCGNSCSNKTHVAYNPTRKKETNKWKKSNGKNRLNILRAPHTHVFTWTLFISFF